jgi:Lrp/AsnC family transcriptional regulator, leucine-responsive regulatory protein
MASSCSSLAIHSPVRHNGAAWPATAEGGAPVNAPDPIDLKILGLLRENASLSSGQIARQLYLSARTVRSRIERLRDAGIIKRFTIEIDREQCGYPATADIVIQAEANRVHQVAERIAQFPEAHYVAVTTGSQDISIQVYGRSTDDIHRFVIEKLAPLPGVIRMNTFVLFKIVKQGCWSPPFGSCTAVPARRERSVQTANTP